MDDRVALRIGQPVEERCHVDRIWPHGPRPAGTGCGSGSPRCRRTASGSPMLAARPTTAERAVETGARRGRRPHARDRPGGRGRSSSPSWTPLHAAGPRFARGLRGARRGRLRRRRGARRDRPDRRLAERQARPPAPRALDRGRRRADDGRRRVRASSTTSAPARSGRRRAAQGATLNGVPLDGRRSASGAAATGRSSWSAIESAYPRGGWPERAAARGVGPPPARARLDRVRALPGRGRPRRRDGDALALPLGRRRRGAADRARERRRSSPSPPSTSRSPRRSTPSRTRPSWPRAPTALRRARTAAIISG